MGVNKTAPLYGNIHRIIPNSNCKKFEVKLINLANGEIFKKKKKIKKLKYENNING